MYYAVDWNEGQPEPGIADALDQPFDTLAQAQAACCRDFACIYTVTPRGLRVVCVGEYLADEDDILWTYFHDWDEENPA